MVKELKNKDLNVRLTELERDQFVSKCKAGKIKYSKMLTQWITSWLDTGVAKSEFNGNFPFEYDRSDDISDSKVVVLNIRSTDSLRNAFKEKCDRLEPIGIGYSRVLRTWINNWVKYGDPNGIDGKPVLKFLDNN